MTKEAKEDNKEEEGEGNEDGYIHTYTVWLDTKTGLIKDKTSITRN